MYIEVSTSIIDSALMQLDDVAIDVLSQITQAIINGKHAIVIKTGDVARLKQYKNLFSKREMVAFDEAGKHFTQTGSISNKLSIKAVLTLKQSTGRIGNIIYINPKDTSNFELYEETHLLTENIEDSDFFKYCIDYYQREERFLHCCTNYYKVMGGGNTTGNIIKYEKSIREHFVCAISDSDYHYKGDKTLGETAKSIQNEMIDNPFNCGFYHMEKVCEIENMIPWVVIQNNTEYKHHFLVKKNIAFDMPFYDMKEGVHIKHLYQDKSFNYWKNLLDVYVSSKEWYKINLNRNKEKKDFENIYGSQTLTNGFGSKVLTNSLKIINSILPVVHKPDLTKSQEYEWMNIGRFIFAWCCAFKRIRI